MNSEINGEEISCRVENEKQKLERALRKIALMSGSDESNSCHTKFIY